MSKKVLTIDDSKTVRIIITKHLAPFGVQILEAENGEQGVARAREGNPDLILLDYNMPVMDGYHTLAELKSDPALKHIPIIMLTTETVQETVIKLIKLGLKDFIAKPFTRELLLKKVNPILSLYQGNELPSAPSTVIAAPLEAVPSGKKVVLAIDDKENILKLLKDYLGERFHMLSAGSGRGAETIMKQNHFDYMFLDLSMPDMNWQDIYNFYVGIKKGMSSPKKVAVMTLRTAQEDIARAAGLGIQQILYKPFVREDVADAIEHLILNETNRKGSHLEQDGDVRILHCPSDKSFKFRPFISALNSNIPEEINDMAEEGGVKLVIQLGEGFLSDIVVTQKFIDLIDHAHKLAISIRLVAESQHAREAIKQYKETAQLPADISLSCALKEFAEA
jgi:two-component system, cell cycle response regulator